MCPQNMHIFKFLIWEWVFLKKGKKKNQIRLVVHILKSTHQKWEVYKLLDQIINSKILKSLLFGNTKTQGVKTIEGNFSIYAIHFYCKVIKMKKKLGMWFFVFHNMANVETFY